jgi:formate hydrogenlyase subunit 6/NADH:ubiquinone oxidoreductase subunit I
MSWDWNLIQGDCTGCGICADVCPHDAIRMTRDLAYPEPVQDRCVGCMICVQQCPFAAIEVHESSHETPHGARHV